MKGYISTVLFFLLIGSITAQPPSGPGTCEPGTYYSSQLFACLLCRVGKYCPGGTTSPNTATQLDCPRSWYSDIGASSCSPCPPGTLGGFGLSSNLAGSCTKCPAGTYQPFSNLSSSGKYDFSRPIIRNQFLFTPDTR